MERLRKLKKKILNPRGLFITALILSYAFVLLHDYTRIGLGRSNNLFLPTDESGVRYVDIDTGMDFFNSIQYVKKKVPYTELETVYPPLANLLFYFLYKYIPVETADLIPETFDDILNARATYADMRVHQAPMMEFLCFVVAALFALYKEFQIILKNSLVDEKMSERLAIAFCFPIGIIYSIERGNIILISLFLLLYFVRNYNSEDKIQKELALIALAVSAGLKLYPALFGILLIADKKYKEAARTIVYGIAAFVLPFFFFEGIDAIKIYFSILSDFSKLETFSIGSYGIQGIFKLLLYFSCVIKATYTNTPLPDFNDYKSAIGTAQNISYLVGILLLVFVLFEKNIWRRYLYIVVAMLTVQLSTQYTNSYLIIPLLYFVVNEKEFEKKNLVEYIGLLIMMLPVPLQLFKIPFLHNPQYTMVKLTYQVGYLILLVITFIRGVQTVKVGWPTFKAEFAHEAGRRKK